MPIFAAKKKTLDFKFNLLFFLFIMKRNTFIILFLLLTSITAFAQKGNKLAKIEFESDTIDMGTFAADTALIECPFVYKNTGEAPLYIHQVFTTCGCTGSKFSSAPTMPGKSDTILITYDGRRKSPGPLLKSITVHCNIKREMIKLYIKGCMLPAKVEPVDDTDF